MKHKPQSVSALLQHQGDLATLIRRARQHASLLREIRQILPEELGAHCSHAVLEGAALHLTVDSPVWAARLRYQAPRLLNQLRVQHPGLANIRIRAVPPPSGGTLGTARSKQGPPPPVASPRAADTVEKASRSLSDARLRHALHRLAQTLRASG